MPIYNYICDECNHQEERVKSMSTVESVDIMLECEKCLSRSFHRVFSIPNVSDGPKSIGTLGEYNAKKYGLPENLKPKKDSTYDKLKKIIGNNTSKERIAKYLTEGK